MKKTACKQIPRLFYILSVVLLLISLSACTEADPAADPSAADDSAENILAKDTVPAVGAPICSFDGILFAYRGNTFDITEFAPAVNAITGWTQVGKHIVVEGHVGPKNSVYCIFNTETESFEAEIGGVNLIWRGDDITTAVYSFWEEIYTYDGTWVASLQMDPMTEYIRSIAFVSDTELEVVISSENGDRTEMISLPAGTK